MPFQIVRNDIVKMRVDAIVNTANPLPVIGSGVDSAIHTAAGPELLRAREAIGPIAIGQAAITDGYLLPCRHVIHTVGPEWIDGMHGESELLASCYRSAVALAEEAGCASVAFPLISSGNYGFPADEALRVATEEINRCLTGSDLMIYLVVFGEHAVMLSQQLFSRIDSFIDEHYV